MTELGRDPEATGPVLKRVDAWWTVLVVDPMAIRVVGAIGSVAWVTPTRLTALAHLLGVVSAGFFLGGWLVAAAVTFEVRFVLDCADGKLARSRGTSTAAGAFLDYVGDYLVVALNIVALSIWLDRQGAIPAPLAIAAPAAFLAHIAAGQAVAREIAAAGRPATLFSSSVSSRYRNWMADRRLKPLPSRIDVEHGVVFLLPLVAGIADSTLATEIAIWVVCVYFGLQTLHITKLGWDLARSRDREGPR